MTPRVLQIGMDPAVIDFTPWPGQGSDQLRRRLDDAVTAMRRAGYDVTVCLLPDDDAAAAQIVERLLHDTRFDVVEIGAGLRTSHEYTRVFERVVNTVSTLQPGIRFCFNDSPETTLEAVRRAFPQ